MIEFLAVGSVIYLLAVVFVMAIRLAAAEDRAEAAEARSEVLASELDIYKTVALTGESASPETICGEPSRN